MSNNLKFTEGLGHISSTGFCFISVAIGEATFKVAACRLPWIPHCAFLDSLRFLPPVFLTPVPKLIVISQLMAGMRCYAFLFFEISRLLLEILVGGVKVFGREYSLT